jgi:hypothetical protein
MAHRIESRDNLGEIARVTGRDIGWSLEDEK